jgi:acyl-CoA thioesterase-1
MKARSVLWAGLCLLASGFLSTGRAADPKPKASGRDILWRIVDTCLKDDGGADYCQNCPAPLLSHLARCADPAGWDSAVLCRKTTEVWDRTKDFVALRDRKMCGCPGGFVHGLALPLRKVTGVEDPAKPAGIWRFAWDEAVKRIGTREQDVIVILANPPARRTQDQLHIHLVRLAEGARRKFLGLRPVAVKDLSEVWTAAARHATAAGLAAGGYGVAVVHGAAADEFLVAAMAESPEQTLSDFSCVSGAAVAPAAPSAPLRKNVVLFLGDSLTAGLGVEPEQAYPALLGEHWRKEGLPFAARNAGVSGSTTADALENLDWCLSQDVGIVFLALGANDGLRGLSLDSSRKNLAAIIEKIRAHGARVVMAEMLLPPNYGKDYTGRFKAMYQGLGRRYGLKMMPFLLDGVAGRPGLNGEDGIHPNAAGHRVVAEHVHDFFAREGLLK